MIRNFLIALILVLPTLIFAQRVVNVQYDILPLIEEGDTLLGLRSTVETTTRLSAATNTSTEWKAFAEPGDTMSLYNQAYAIGYNDLLTPAALMQQATQFRTYLARHNFHKAAFATIGLDFDALIVAQEKSKYLGKYALRYEGQPDSIYRVEIIDHPNRNDVLLMTGFPGGNKAVSVYVGGFVAVRNLTAIRDNRYIMPTGEANGRTRFSEIKANLLPVQMGGVALPDVLRLTKLQ